MALTLIEMAKTAPTPVAQAVIEMFARASGWISALPFNNIPGNAYAYNREAALPGVAYRGIGESYTESTGVINPLSEALRIGGGDLDVDIALVRMFGPSRRAREESMKIKALMAAATNVMMNGDSEINPREPDGLKKRVVGSQRIANSAASGGAPLSLMKLDEAIDAVPGAGAILLPKALRRRFTQVARNASVGGVMEQSTDQLGRRVTLYNGLPLLVAYEENDGVEPLQFNEVASGGGAAVTTSLFVVRLGDGYLSGIQNAAPDVRDLGELQSGAPMLRTRVEWLHSWVIEHGRAVARLDSITDAPITA